MSAVNLSRFALLAGSRGAGKTLAREMLASELGIDLNGIDLTTLEALRHTAVTNVYRASRGLFSARRLAMKGAVA